ncbi:MAG: hypothetical protein RJA44_1457 [Pseudomonadota bacterium]
MCFSPAFRQRLLRRPLGWLLALLALVALQAHAMQRIALPASMAGMDPELCSAMVVTATAPDSADPANAGLPDGSGSTHCQHACVGPLGGLDLLAVTPTEPLVGAGLNRYDAPTLLQASPVCAAWPSGRPRAPPQL